MKNSFIDTIDQIIESSKSVEFDIKGFNHDFLRTELHFKWLAKYIGVHKPKKSLELGRREGNSVYAMAYYLPDDCFLDSYDLNMNGNVVNKPNVNIQSYNGKYSELNLNDYNFIFIDINGGGEKEYEIYNQANEQEYEGIIAWDDVGSQWVKDEHFWDLLPEDIKYKAPLHGEHFGFTYHEKR